MLCTHMIFAGELANALQKKKRKSLPAVQQPLSAGTSDSTSDSTTTTSKPSESTITTSTPSEVKTAEGKTAEVEDSVFDDTTPAKQKVRICIRACTVCIPHSLLF